jgi:hypothetical protein
VIWVKTEAGRTEMQAKSLIKERPLRTLLLLIDGVKTDAMLLGNVANIEPHHFAQLEGMGLIEPSAAAAGANPAPPRPAPEPVARGPLDYARFTQTLTELISRELGLRGFTLTLAVEKAGTIDQLRDVADRTVKQIRDRKGLASAEQARRALFG